MDQKSSDRLCDSTMSHRISPKTMRVFVTASLLLTHALFLYGQTAIMWYLFFEIQTDLQVQAHSLEAKLAFKALKLHNPQNVTLNVHNTIQAFTYMDAIRGLWTGRTGPVVDPNYHNPGPGQWGKVSAVLLICFSAIWPHVKLIGLNYQYHRGVKVGEGESRTTTLYWLDTFGKWSLADVFVICSLLAVLNLDIPLEAPKVLDALVLQIQVLTQEFTRKDKVSDVSRAVCQQLFFPQADCDFSFERGDCSRLEDSCSRCACGLETLFPTVNLLLAGVQHILKGVSAEGNLIAVLRVAGRSGIYIFCLATLGSLSLSWVIDAIDHRTRSKRRSHTRTLEEGAFFSAVNHARSKEDSSKMSLVVRANTLSGLIGPSASSRHLVVSSQPFSSTLPSNSEAAVNQALLVPLQTPAVAQTASEMRSIHPAKWMLPVSLLGLACAIGGAFLPTLQRRAPGSIMTIVRDDLNVSFTREYSVYDLVELTGVAGGPDYLLFISFGLFVVFGPIFRGFIICLLAFVPLPSRPQRKLAFYTSTLGVFAGWDVLLVAFILVRLEMPRITQGIVSPSLPICRFLHQLGSEPYCISIEFLFIWPQFLLIPVATFALVFSAARIVRLAFFTFDPFGDGYQGAPKIVANLVA